MPETKGISINTGRVSVDVIDPNGLKTQIVFNPSDATFREKFFAMAAGCETKFAEYAAREEDIDAKFPEVNKSDDEEYTLDERKMRDDRATELLRLERDMCDFMEQSIDEIFGHGTCVKAFAEDRVPPTYLMLIEELARFFDHSSDAVMGQYLEAKKNRQQRRKAKNK